MHRAQFSGLSIQSIFHYICKKTQALFFQVCVEILKWSKEDAKFPLEGRLLYSQLTDPGVGVVDKSHVLQNLSPVNAILAVQSDEEVPDIVSEEELIFPSGENVIKEAHLVLLSCKKASKERVS